ncbi:hypothetical protein Cyast_0718 [Cyanobacterium stanieri PCC 7202]|uniref:Methyltransferase FkbM domain-containing protein n=1 Tax=Cyanobacterium stanieri (strain ATCC 29140 / PCC 7202) TaxID=292563 RepID=K9YJR0_CYASC|nr:hypothetical protein Cyast_0718 [Cyanobacterium stanieri PCC 7202]
MFSKIKNKTYKLFDVIKGKYYTYLITQYKYHQLSFSQEGEDRILNRFFERQEKGFYVDVGAHHPQRFSNTYLFYLKGWRGINIDPLPGSMEKFNQLRSNDINLELAISNQNESLTYYQFNEPALNGFSEDLAKERDGLRGEYRIVGKTELNSRNQLADVWPDLNERVIRQKQLLDVQNNMVDTWDYIWSFSCTLQKAFSILPMNNLIQNIGFGMDATHTRGSDKRAFAKTNELSICTHPEWLYCPVDIENERLLRFNPTKKLKLKFQIIQFTKSIIR